MGVPAVRKYASPATLLTRPPCRTPPPPAPPRMVEHLPANARRLPGNSATSPPPALTSSPPPPPADVARSATPSAIASRLPRRPLRDSSPFLACQIVPPHRLSEWAACRDTAKHLEHSCNIAAPRSSTSPLPARATSPLPAAGRLVPP